MDLLPTPQHEKGFEELGPCTLPSKHKAPHLNSPFVFAWQIFWAARRWEWYGNDTAHVRCPLPPFF